MRFRYCVVAVILASPYVGRELCAQSPTAAQPGVAEALWRALLEKEADISIRASAQGLFMLMTNGIGAFLGTWISGYVVDYFTYEGVKDWRSIWFCFASYALIIGLVFPFVFRYKHPIDKASLLSAH